MGAAFTVKGSKIGGSPLPVPRRSPPSKVPKGSQSWSSCSNFLNIYDFGCNKQSGRFRISRPHFGGFPEFDQSNKFWRHKKLKKRIRCHQICLQLLRAHVPSREGLIDLWEEQCRSWHSKTNTRQRVNLIEKYYIWHPQNFPHRYLLFKKRVNRENTTSVLGVNREIVSPPRKHHLQPKNTDFLTTLRQKPFTVSIS